MANTTQPKRRSAARSAAVLAAAGLATCWFASCNSHPVDPLDQNIAAEREDIVTAVGAAKVDILWVVDSSGSMCQEQAGLRDNFDRFVEELDKLRVDFNLAVITTDMDDVTKSGRFQNTPDDRPALGNDCATEPPDISACPSPDTTGESLPPLVISSSDETYLKEDGSLDTEKIKLHFGCNATVGVRGNNFEMGLEAAKTALSPQLLDGFNSGFLREDAYLAVLFLTDENDCSTDDPSILTTGSNCEWRRDELVPTQEYIDFFSSLKKDAEGNPDPGRVIMGGIIAPDNGQRFETGETIRESCTSSFGIGFAGYRYADVINSFDQSQVASVCNESYAQVLDSLSVLFREILSFQCLEAPPLTCETNADCAGTCEERGVEGGSSIKVCDSFRVQVEINRPAELGAYNPPGGEPFPIVEKNAEQGQCEALTGDREGFLRCILRETTDEADPKDFSILYGSPQCTGEDTIGTGIAINLQARLDANDALSVRYPRSLEAVEAPAGTDANNGTNNASTNASTSGETSN